MFLALKDQPTASGPWASLPRRRFGDVWERTYAFDDQSITLRDTGTGFHISSDPFNDIASSHLVSPSEITTYFSSQPLMSTIIQVGHKIHVFSSGKHHILTTPVLAEEEGAAATSSDALTSPMPATVIEVRVKAGDTVKEGQVVCVLESMKMEISIRSGRDGVVGDVNVGKGEVVEEGKVLVALKPLEAERTAE